MGWRSVASVKPRGDVRLRFSQVGKTNVNVEPLFRPALCGVIVPLWAFHKRFADGQTQTPVRQAVSGHLVKSIENFRQ